MANLRNIQFLRSSTLYANLEAAKAALTAQVDNMRDGSPILGRYTFGEGASAATKTLIGIAHVGLSGETGITFFESADDVAKAIAELQSEMDATQTAVGTDADGHHVQSSSHFTSAATTVEGEIAALAAALEALNYTKEVGESEVFSKVVETEGLVSAQTKNLTTVKLAGYAEGGDDSGKVAATDTLGEALGKLQGQINGMDKAASAVDGQVVTTITETDGKVSETKANVKDLQLGGYAKTNDTGDIASGDTVNVALSKLENKAAAITITNEDGSVNVTPTTGGTDINVNIKTGETVLAKDGDNGLYTNIRISGITPSSTTVKEEYALIGTNDSQLGQTIKIYKDSSLVSITYITDPSDDHYQNLEYVYIDASGNTQTEYVDMSTLVLEAEFASGVTVTDAGIVTGVVDSQSESVITGYSTSGGDETAKVLSVGEGGFKVDNIQNAINAAVDRAQTTIDTAVTSSDETKAHMTIAETVADDGSKSYKFTTTDIASEDALDAEVARAKSAETSIDSAVGLVKASGSESRSYTKTGTQCATGTTVLADIELIDAAIVDFSGQSETVSEAINDLDDRVIELSGKSVTDFTSANGSIDIATAATANGTVTVDLGTDADQISGLTAVADITQGAAKVSGVTATDSVKTGIERLYASLKSEIDARKAAILARTISSTNGGITVTETPNADGFSTNIALTLDGTTQGTGYEKTGTDNALTITDSGLFLSTDWECGTF